MIGLIFLAGAIIAGVGVVANFWKDIKDWLQRAAKKVEEIIRGVVHGVKIFAKKTREAFEEISRHYSKDKQGQWEETTVTRKISANEVPDDILAMAGASEREVDITEKLELQLS